VGSYDDQIAIQIGVFGLQWAYGSLASHVLAQPQGIHQSPDQIRQAERG